MLASHDLTRLKLASLVICVLYIKGQPDLAGSKLLTLDDCSSGTYWIVSESNRAASTSDGWAFSHGSQCPESTHPGTEEAGDRGAGGGLLTPKGGILNKFLTR